MGGKGPVFVAVMAVVLRMLYTMIFTMELVVVIKGKSIPGIRVNALPSNTGILTCLANDTGYENIFSNQLDVLGNKDDLLIVLSKWKLT